MLHEAVFLATCNTTMTIEKFARHVTQSCEKQRIVLLFLQLAKQHYVALRVVKVRRQGHVTPSNFLCISTIAAMPIAKTKSRVTPHFRKLPMQQNVAFSAEQVVYLLSVTCQSTLVTQFCFQNEPRSVRVPRSREISR